MNVPQMKRKIARLEEKLMATRALVARMLPLLCPHLEVGDVDNYLKVKADAEAVVKMGKDIKNDPTA